MRRNIEFGMVLAGLVILLGLAIADAFATPHLDVPSKLLAASKSGTNIAHKRTPEENLARLGLIIIFDPDGMYLVTRSGYELQLASWDMLRKAHKAVCDAPKDGTFVPLYEDKK